MEKKVTFKLGDYQLAEFILVDYTSVKELKIDDFALLQSALRRKITTIDAVTLKSIFDRFLGVNLSLKEYVDYYSEHYFFTPYQHNLGILISDVIDEGGDCSRLENKAIDLNDPGKILTQVILDFSISEYYNFIPGSSVRARNYYYNLLKKARKIAEEKAYTEEQCKIIDSMTAFVISYDGPDGLDDYLIGLNPKLAFFCTPYDIIEDVGLETITNCDNGITLKFMPTTEQLQERKKYFDSLCGDFEQLFMMELLEIIKKYFD